MKLLNHYLKGFPYMGVMKDDLLKSITHHDLDWIIGNARTLTCIKVGDTFKAMVPTTKRRTWACPFMPDEVGLGIPKLDGILEAYERLAPVAVLEFDAKAGDDMFNISKLRVRHKYLYKFLKLHFPSSEVKEEDLHYMEPPHQLSPQMDKLFQVKERAGLGGGFVYLEPRLIYPLMQGYTGTLTYFGHGEIILIRTRGDEIWHFVASNKAEEMEMADLNTHLDDQEEVDPFEGQAFLPGMEPAEPEEPEESKDEDADPEGGEES